jgi:hypothetical protein
MRTLSLARAAILIPILAAAVGCGARPAARGHVFQYGDDDVVRFLRSYGHDPQREVDASWQNAAGTAVYLSTDGVVWVVDAGTPEVRRVECSPAHEWLDANGRRRPLPPFASASPYTRLDQQSGYFCQMELESSVIRVGHVDRPAGWLLERDAGTPGFHPDRICATGDTVVLAEVKDGNRATWGDRRDNLWIMRPDSGTPGEWVTETRRLDATIICVDPFGPRLLCASYGMLPTPSRLFLYDLASGRRTDLGLLRARRHAFVLRDDFLGQRMEHDERNGPKAAAPRPADRAGPVIIDKPI